MDKVNFDTMSREELAHYIVAHRDTSEAIEARRVFIHRMAEKVKIHGIELHQPKVQPKQSTNE